MKTLRLLLSTTLLFACVPAPAANAAAGAYRPGDPSQAERVLFFSGTITPGAVDVIKRYAKDRPGISVLQIDSGGGELPAALDLAELVRSKGWDIVVKHQCLSACAYHVFPAARRKTVLPHAWVGIHSVARTVFHPDGHTTPLSGSAMRGWEQTVDNPKFRAATVAMYQRRAELSLSLGLSFAFENEYDDYMERRKRVVGEEDVDAFPATPGCPRYKMWALDKRQLEAMGVTGIADFWFPRTEADRKSLHEPPYLPPGSIFFGDAAQLRRTCTGPRLGRIAKLWLLHKPDWWR